jgi:CHAD domain-containing protein
MSAATPVTMEETSAHDLLAPALFSLITAVRRAAERARSPEARSAEPDPEAIHDLRVAIRRLRTLLRPARRLYGKGRVRAIGEELRAFAATTGALRDEEVLRETLGALALPRGPRAELDAWMSRRMRQERARRRGVEAALHRGDEGSLASALAQLERRLGKRRPAETTAVELGRAAISEALAGVHELRDAPPEDGPAMHALRIRFKRLRYTSELFARILGEGTGALGASAARMQKLLGELHDLDEATIRIDRARALSEATRRSVRGALVRARARAVKRVRTELAGELERLLTSG